MTGRVWLRGALVSWLLATGCAQGGGSADTGTAMDSSRPRDTGIATCAPACGPSQICRLGRCRPACAPDESCGTGICCGGACVNTDLDPFECGACGNVCAPVGNMCASGTCKCGNGPACATGETCCGAACINLADSTDNCGACGVRCASGAMCIDGDCVAPLCPAPCNTGEACVDGACRCGAGPACGGGSACCGDMCIDVLSDAVNCGSCGAVCPAGQMCMSSICTSDVPCVPDCAVGEVCDGGTCRCGTGLACAVGQSCCAGTCTTTDTELNCGVCGTACGGGERCCGGLCTNVTMSIDNCGRCDNDCQPTGDTCSGSTCFCGLDPPCPFGLPCNPIFPCR